MYHEIINQTLNEIKDAVSQITITSINSFMELILDSKRIFITGSGRSGLMMKSFCMRLIQMNVEAFVIGETVTPAICPDDLLIVGSGSGETASLVPLVSRAKEIGARIASITTSPDSSIGIKSDLIIKIDAYSPKKNSNKVFSIQPLGSQFEQSLLIFLEVVTMLLIQMKEIDYDTMMTRHANLE